MTDGHPGGDGDDGGRIDIACRVDTQFQVADPAVDILLVLDIQRVDLKVRGEQLVGLHIAALFFGGAGFQAQAGNIGVEPENGAGRLEAFDIEGSISLNLAHIAVEQVVDGEGCRQVCAHLAFQDNRIRIQEVFRQLGKVDVPFDLGPNGGIVEKVIGGSLDVERDVASFHDQLLHLDE